MLSFVLWLQWTRLLWKQCFLKKIFSTEMAWIQRLPGSSSNFVTWKLLWRLFPKESTLKSPQTSFLLRQQLLCKGTLKKARHWRIIKYFLNFGSCTQNAAFKRGCTLIHTNVLPLRQKISLFVKIGARFLSVVFPHEVSITSFHHAMKSFSSASRV